MLRFKLTLQHMLNPLHVYCRLAPILGKEKAIAFSRRYESIYAKVL